MGLPILIQILIPIIIITGSVITNRVIANKTSIILFIYLSLLTRVPMFPIIIYSLFNTGLSFCSYPYGLLSCQRHVSSHITSIPLVACQFSFFRALVGFA